MFSRTQNPAPLAFALACLGTWLARVGVSATPPVPPVDLPHPYYFHELYLPQLTAGPSSLAWSPDSKELVYSMGGSLWRQRIDSDSARQLTAGPGYDYQPDWSPDGRSIVFVRAQGNAYELWLLDVASGQSHALTQGGAVNVEPRFSPDGTRVLYVSSAYQRHLHVFAATLEGGTLGKSERLTGENKSPLPRYYYSPYDHEINPLWSRDGKSILYVSNRGRIHGTGGLWRAAAEPNATATELHYEETNWGMRADLAPEGERLVYSSYLGRNHLQLWLLPAGGGQPFPFTYGDWDETSPRWSPDGHWIASISNRTGDTQLALRELPGAHLRLLNVRERQYLTPVGRVHLRVLDARGVPTPARVAVQDAAGRAYAPAGAWMHHAEFDRNEEPFEARYFHSAGDDWFEAPAGTLRLTVMKGFTRMPEERELTVRAGETSELSVTLETRPWRDGAQRRWVSADVHVHMNYGGHYRNTPAHLRLQAQAEDLDIVQDLIVNKEQRIPDIAYSGAGVDAASTPGYLIVHGQEFHTSYWGHLGLLGLEDGVILPGYAGYPNTAAASLAPSNADVADIAHAHGALVGYVHPFEEPPEPVTHPAHTDADELPVDVALGKVDYLEIVAFSDHQATAAVWYRLLNLGFHLPAAGGTDAMADYATLRGPVGLNRVYASLPEGALTSAGWLKELKDGRTFATNGPLLEFALGGLGPGGTLELASTRSAPFTARLFSIVPLEKVQVVCEGKVVRDLGAAPAGRELHFAGSIPLRNTGWCLLRAVNTRPQFPVLDNFVYATTSPVYVKVAGAAARSPEDARYFIAWITHLAERTAAYPDWNSAAERTAVLAELTAARQVYEHLQ
ncbi:MAG: CehA/McbA family metallohydrolase [Gammaproteobacteria bacterium]|nr:CehA/McbA family metallohydrolase [Gammaproteobacteria bacterium]